MGGWNAVDLYRMDYLDGTVWDLGGNWEGGTVPDNNDDVYVRHGGDVSVLLDSVAGDLTIRDGSSVSTNDNMLAVSDDVTIEAAHQKTIGPAPQSTLPFEIDIALRHDYFQ